MTFNISLKSEKVVNMKKTYQFFKKSSYLSAENLNYLEQNHEQFESLNDDAPHILKEDVVKSFQSTTIPKTAISVETPNAPTDLLPELGYRFANINPLESAYTKESVIKALHDLGYEIDHVNDMTFAQYCGTKALDVYHLVDKKAKDWLHAEFIKKTNINKSDKLNLLKELVAASGFEKYLDLKFVGQKRFSLEGNDALIPFLNRIISQLPDYDYESISIGMAHRGRLNVLLNVCGMLSETLLSMFSGHEKAISETSGDVKYHAGFKSVRDVNGTMIPITLANNPSHLEFITPVVMGEVRGIQKTTNSMNHLALTIHGDAAFSGQGTVMESLSMSNLPANTVGGTLHVVVDNVIGFTNDSVQDMRSSFGCADIAKMIDAPIFYVNADDPEACLTVADLAIKYIKKYRKSAFVVLQGYRRHGHNEGDEPSMTSPEKYTEIKSHPICADIYAKNLMDDQLLTEDVYATLQKDYKAILDAGKATIDNTKILDKKQHYLEKENWRSSYKLNLSKDDLLSLAKHITTLPNDFECHKSVMRVMKQRSDMASEARPLDWGMAELLAYAVLLSNGHSIRLNGQDAQRGTFSHRHAILHDLHKDKHKYSILSSVCAANASFDIYNSLLSEQGVLGFEYGYSLIANEDLVIWEAQFGDFANGAQVIIDQFISSGMQKWLETSKIMMYLPHGYEGMGPEHTSGRLERFLQLSAQNNIQICTPTTPAQMFHMILRQYHRDFTRPLIVMTPKSLLRSPYATSTIDELVDGQFETVIDRTKEKKSVEGVILSSGKVYYDLLLYMQKHDKHYAIIQLEQLYPFPDIELEKALKEYAHIKNLFGVKKNQ